MRDRISMQMRKTDTKVCDLYTSIVRPIEAGYSELWIARRFENAAIVYLRGGVRRRRAHFLEPNVLYTPQISE